MKYDILLRPLSDEDGGGYVGFVPDLQGCMSDGETLEEALTNTLEALQEWIELHEETGRPIPNPGAAANRAIKSREAMISAIRVLSEHNGALEKHIEEIEAHMSQVLDMIRENTGWTFAHLSKGKGADTCDA